MRNLVLPAIDPHKVLDDIIDAKRGVRSTRLSLVAPLLHSCFDEYDRSKMSLEHINIRTWEEVEKSDLEHCYVGSTQPLDALKHKIRDAQPQICRRYCQYCGLQTVGNTFDHYLPKESFPEYAAYGFNLIPCCSECNTKKSDKFLQNDERQFMNLYYDSMPQGKYLFVRIFEYKNEFVAEYYLGASVSPLIQNHFNSLELLKRFTEAAPDVFSEIQVGSKLGVSLNEAQNYICYTADIEKNRYSINHWRVVLYQELLVQHDVLQKLIYKNL